MAYSGQLRDLAGNANRFVIIDTETTGLRNSDRIVEIAILTMSLDGEITDSWETLIQPERHVGAAEIHGITPSMLVNAPIFKQVAGDIAERLDGACVVGHYVGSFDLRMLSNEYKQLRTDFLSGKYLDTRKVFSGRLIEACLRFNISLENAHSAKADAEAAAKLFLAGFREFNTKGSASQIITQHSSTGRSCSRGKVGATAGRACDRGELYLQLLNQVLADGVIDDSERHELAALASELQLTPDEIEVFCLENISRKIDEILEDGIVTDQELEELQQTLEQCGVGFNFAERRVRDYLDNSVDSIEVVLEAGDTIVVTGMHLNFSRDKICAILESRGFSIGSNVTRSKTKLLLAADPNSESGKAKQARKFGIPIMPLEEFSGLHPVE